MKEKINLFMKNKFLIILFSFIICLFILCSNSFAAFSFIDSNGETINLPELSDLVGGKDFTILHFNGSNPYYVLYTFSDASDVYVNEHFLYVPNKIDIYEYHINDANEWYLYNTFEDFSSSGFCSKDYFIYSSFTIYDEKGDVFFQLAPQIVEQVTIPEITQVEEIPQAMGEVLKILIPIGLIVFSIGLVIYLMRLVISRLT